VKRPTLRVGSGRLKRTAIPGARAHRQHQNSTSARVKEAAFQLVRNHIDSGETWVFYDLFAGSGQMGIEALSLGAQHATFVDIVPERLSDIQHALQSLDIERDAFTLVRSRANKVLTEAFTIRDAQVVVWADPPYTYGNSPSNDPANLIMLYRASVVESPGPYPVLILQLHEKNPAMVPEFLDANPDLHIYRYGSNCLLVLHTGEIGSTNNSPAD
jgi:16S rRNA (guanine966-N2)-methyltransferase